ncbi:MAG: NAD(+)/NADH kinase [Lachnospiraceae bacterium]|nr:NAD(+)/NADH kinase [Lachnospiraceae bacterium]
MKNFSIIIRDAREKYMSVAKQMEEKIKRMGGFAEIIIEPEKGSNEALAISKDCECIFTVGGDGALIRTAKRTVDKKVPLLGVNLGHLGYLCDLDSESVLEAIDSLFEGNFEIEERMMLEGNLLSNEEEKNIALNDIVISSENSTQVIEMIVYVNGTILYHQKGDGMIISTPTGSTAYNLSARGPIVDPLTELILLTPLNPHTLLSRSIVLPDAAEVAIEIRPRRTHTIERARICFDGSGPGSSVFSTGDRAVVRKAREKVRMIRLSKLNFLERISKKFKEEGGF